MHQEPVGSHILSKRRLFKIAAILLAAAFMTACPAEEDDNNVLNNGMQFDPCEVLQNCDEDDADDGNNMPNDADDSSDAGDTEPPDDVDPDDADDDVAPDDADDDTDDGDVDEGDVDDDVDEPDDADDGDVDEPDDVDDGDVEPDDASDVEDEPTPEGCVFDNPPCPRGFACNDLTNECEEIPPGCANANPPCPTDQVCDVDNNVCVACLADSDCPGPEVCDVDNNVCVGCFADADCPGLLVCDTDANTCIERVVCNDINCDEEIALCTSSADCEEGRFCTPDGCAEAEVECGFGDAICPDGQICIAGECESVECANDDDCSGDRRCNEQNFCVECTEDSDCPGVCINNICLDCREDAECPGNQTCEEFINLCTEPEGECTSNDDCDGARVCQAGECVGDACVDDALEPNDQPEDSRALTEGTTALRSCGDQDWFEFELTAGDGILAQITYDPGVFMEIVVQDPEGAAFQRFVDPGQIGVIQATIESAPLTGTYRMGLDFIDAFDNDYEITVLPVPGGYCANDGREPSNEPSQAAPINTQALFNEVARICDGDADWFSAELQADAGALLTVNAFDFPVIVEVFGPDQQTRILRDSSPRMTKTIEFIPEESGLHFIRIEALNDGDETFYDIGVTLP